ncbi:MAG: alpha/beta hydrolase fold domain-containing protein [Bacteroidales bacterium]|jgi:dienelactone hydrolase|nr:alpha/beta hydrolase fold domain-containing protein [Bacteroidales bacterium]MCI2121923.1 alpha/beta hydrolase fold domain-containing protein [Bacteroidales bacterium]MCI2145454.1 alpha/beta hydrolase fold domain-containing protein [Bacteroidales bacterium]
MKRVFSLLVTMLVTAALACAQPVRIRIDTVRHYSPDSTVAMITYDTVRMATYDYCIPYCKRDTGDLVMYMYMPADDKPVHPCVVYVFGGGFASSSLLRPDIVGYCRRLADHGIVVAAIDYRLYLRGYKMKGGLLSMIKPAYAAVEYAADDCFDAVRYLIDNASSCRIDPKQIILEGSSAGAITALQCNYELCNGLGNSSVLPEGFRFAGVISYSGGIYSKKGSPKYADMAPAPTMFYHGTKDGLVFYNKFQFFNLGLFGSSHLVKEYDKKGYPYFMTRVKDHTHDVADYMNRTYDDCIWFIDSMAVGKKNLQVDRIYNDMDDKPDTSYSSNAAELYH